VADGAQRRMAMVVRQSGRGQRARWRRLLWTDGTVEEATTNEEWGNVLQELRRLDAGCLGRSAGLVCEASEWTDGHLDPIIIVVLLLGD
jgi:hypothetical protein